MNAGPRNGSTARMPRRSPLSERSAAFRTRSSPGSARSAPSTIGCVTTARATSATRRARLLDEDGPRQAERDALPASPHPDVDRTLELALGDDGEVRARRQATALELAQPARVVVGDALDDDLLPRPGLTERPVAHGAELAPERRDGV